MLAESQTALRTMLPNDLQHSDCENIVGYWGHLTDLNAKYRVGTMDGFFELIPGHHIEPAELQRI